MTSNYVYLKIYNIVYCILLNFSNGLYIILSCQGTEPAGELKYNFRYSRCFLAAVLSRLGPLMLFTSCMFAPASKHLGSIDGWHPPHPWQHSEGQDSAFSSNYEDRRRPRRWVVWFQVHVAWWSGEFANVGQGCRRHSPRRDALWKSYSRRSSAVWTSCAASTASSGWFATQTHHQPGCNMACPCRHLEGGLLEED